MPPPDAAAGTVTDEFDRIGAHYDRLTGMSPGYAAQLRFSAEQLVGLLGPRRGAAALEGRPLRVADIGCGSGTSTRALLRALAAAGVSAQVDGIDGSAGMLAAARAKPWPAGVTFRHAQAQDLLTPSPAADEPSRSASAETSNSADQPNGADDGRYEAIFAAYLLRNVPDKDAFLATARRLLAPGGVLLVHEYGVAGRPLDVLAWTALSWGVIIPSAVVVTRRPQLFTYLWRSVLDFDSDERLRDRLAAAGFAEVGQRAVPGWQRGMVRATWGRRP